MSKNPKPPGRLLQWATVVPVLVLTSQIGAVSALIGVVLGPEIGVAAATVALGGIASAVANNRWTPLRGLAEEKLVRSLRKGRPVEGVVVPFRLVQSQEGPCCAFDHVVHRCNVCACTRPCSRAGGGFRAEDRGAGRFVVYGEREIVLIDGTEVRFASSLAARMTSHFHRLEAGQRVVVHGVFDELESIDDDVRSLYAGTRDSPRVLTPRDGGAVLVEPLDR